jgi:hypothetical protein
VATPEEAQQEQDAAAERFYPVAAYAIGSALNLEPPNFDVPVPPGIEPAVKLILLDILVWLITGSKTETPDAPMPTPTEIQHTADVMTPPVVDEAWNWAVEYAKSLDEAGTKSGITTDQLDARAQALARTLATRATSEGALATGHLLSMPYKIWITRGDPTVRESHRRLHGHPVPMDTPFRKWPTGQVLDFPGDPRAPLNETANCRCMVIFAETAEGVSKALAPANLDEAFTMAASAQED